MSRQEGFSLWELLCVVAIMGVLLCLAAPAASHWRENAQYRKAAREIASSLRESRSRAISTNLEHRVEIDLSQGRYRLTHGNRAANSTASSWANNVVRDWHSLPTVINLRANVDCSVTQGTILMHFNPSGSSNTRYFCVLDSADNNRYRVGIPYAATARVRIQQWCGKTQGWR